jgi:hypothetical protein
MFEPSSSVKAMRCRKNAVTCGIFAVNAVSRSDRDLLLRMQCSWLERAHYQDLIDGLPPLPPTRSSALAVPRRQ